MSGDELARTSKVRELAEAGAHHHEDWASGHLATDTYERWLTANVSTFYDFILGIPPPAGQDERVTEMVKRLREMAESVELTSDRGSPAHRDWAQAADLLESTAARLAEADAVIAADNGGVIVPVLMRELTKWQNDALERHAARAGKGETR